MDMDKKDMLERGKCYRRAYMKEGFAAGSGGNVSIRIRGTVCISPEWRLPGGPGSGGGHDYA
ncbi:MAG: hypothetical protein ACLR0U_18240 [Enterocloster clostridioformis]